MGVKLSAVQFAFTLFVLLETWLVPFEGWLIDRFGSRLLVTLGGLMVGLSWIGSGMVTSLSGLYFWYGFAGAGAGAAYGACMGQALKWFPDRRGLAAGLTAGSYGFGTAWRTSRRTSRQRLRPRPGPRKTQPPCPSSRLAAPGGGSPVGVRRIVGRCRNPFDRAAVRLSPRDNISSNGERRTDTSTANVMKSGVRLQTLAVPFSTCIPTNTKAIAQKSA